MVAVPRVFESTRTQAQGVLDNPQLVELRSRREQQRYTNRDIEAYLADVVNCGQGSQEPASPPAVGHPAWRAASTGP